MSLSSSEAVVSLEVKLWSLPVFINPFPPIFPHNLYFNTNSGCVEKQKSVLKLKELCSRPSSLND